MARLIKEIAMEIEQDWGGNINPNAADALDGMKTLHSIEDNYLADSGSTVVGSFLANATSWQGETARRIKAELRAMMPK